MKKILYVALVLVMQHLVAGCEKAPEETPLQSDDTRPNILLIAVDDMGYSDIGPFGSEIETPNIDSLASNGVRFTNFYVGPSCSPTRSMLFSGNDNHVAGLGNMGELLAANQIGQPGYEFCTMKPTSYAVGRMTRCTTASG